MEETSYSQLACTCRGNKDLNRDYPDPIQQGHANLGPVGREQPETLAMMAWTNSTGFTASAQLHEVSSGGCRPIDSWVLWAASSLKRWP